MFTLLINVENATYSLSGAQFFNEFLVLPHYPPRRPANCIHMNISYDKYLLVPERSQMLSLGWMCSYTLS